MCGAYHLTGCRRLFYRIILRMDSRSLELTRYFCFLLVDVWLPSIPALSLVQLFIYVAHLLMKFASSISESERMWEIDYQVWMSIALWRGKLRKQGIIN